jgi:hypothetical protein
VKALVDQHREVVLAGALRHSSRFVQIAQDRAGFQVAVRVGSRFYGPNGFDQYRLQKSLTSAYDWLL